jgi:hypothetical protein
MRVEVDPVAEALDGNDDSGDELLDDWPEIRVIMWVASRRLVPRSSQFLQGEIFFVG